MNYFLVWSQNKFFQTSKWKNQKMDIYKCPKSKIQKNFSFKNFNILYNKLKFLLKDRESLVKKKHLPTSFLDSLSEVRVLCVGPPYSLNLKMLNETLKKLKIEKIVPFDKLS